MRQLPLLTHHAGAVLLVVRGSRRWIRIKCACLGIFVLDLVLSAALPTAYVRYARALWPVYFIERNENIRKIVGSLLHAIPKIANVVVLVLVHITLFGVFAFVFFAGVSDENCEAWVGGSTAQRCSTYIIDGCSDYFQTLGQSILQLFILSTTANFPDVCVRASPSPTRACDTLHTYVVAERLCVDADVADRPWPCAACVVAGDDAGLPVQLVVGVVFRGVPRHRPVLPGQPHHRRDVHHLPRAVQEQDPQEAQPASEGALASVRGTHQERTGACWRAPVHG